MRRLSSVGEKPNCRRRQLIEVIEQRAVALRNSRASIAGFDPRHAGRISERRTVRLVSRRQQAHTASSRITASTVANTDLRRIAQSTRAFCPPALYSITSYGRAAHAFSCVIGAATMRAKKGE